MPPFSHQSLNPSAFTAPYIFFSSDRENELVYVSPSIEQVLGLSPELTLGKKCEDLVDLEHALTSDIASVKEKRFVDGSIDIETYQIVCRSPLGFKILNVQSYGEADHTGQVVYNHGIAQDITSKFSQDHELQQRYEKLKSISRSLSDRETEVLQLVLKGRLNKTIARKLEVTERTIESVRSRLRKKFGSSNSAELVRLATEFEILGGFVYNDDNSNSNGLNTAMN